MSHSVAHFVRSVSGLLLGLVGAACSGDAGSAANPAGTNRARFVFDVDLQGVAGTLTMDVEVLGNYGVTWGPGVQPQITGVISAGTYTIYTAGELHSPTAHYSFRGENAFADFTEAATFERFRVRWIPTHRGLRMVVNPFGPGPVTYECVMRSSRAL